MRLYRTLQGEGRCRCCSSCLWEGSREEVRLETTGWGAQGGQVQGQRGGRHSPSTNPLRAILLLVHWVISWPGRD